MTYPIYTDDGIVHEGVPSVEMPADAGKTVYNKFIAENDVPAAPEGELEVTQNGTYDVADKASVHVQVEGGAVETQEKSITPTTSAQEVTPDTGKLLSKVTVNPIPSQYIIPTGTKQITENGSGIDVSQYAAIDVNVQAAGAPTMRAEYTGSSVLIGTDVSTLSEFVNIYITFSDGTEISLGDDDVGPFDISGSIAVEGSNTLTVSFGGMTAQFTVTGYAIHTHTATFKADGVTVGTVTFEEGQARIDEPAVPAKSHYTGAWESYTLGTTDITINAVYTAIQYTITFKDDGGNHPQNYTEPTAGSVTAPPPTPRSGYTVAWPSWSVGYNNSQVVEAVYTQEQPIGPTTVSFRAALTNGGTTGFAISLSDTATTMSTHNPPDNDRWVISSRSGTRGAGAPNSVHLVRTGGGGSISEIIASLNKGNYIVSAGGVSEMSYVSGDNDYVWIKAGSNFTGNTGTATDIYYTVTLTWN